MAPSKLSVTFEDGKSFLDAYFPNGSLGGVLADSSADLPLGALVDVELRFREGPRRPFRVKGRVAWRRLRGGGDLKPGVGVEFLATERAARDALLAFARDGQSAFIERSHERVPSKLKVKVKGRSLPERSERAGDLSEGGVFVAAPLVVPVGEEVVLTLRPPWSLRGFSVRGRVTWHRAGEERGMGVKFLFDSDEQRAKVASLVHQLAQKAR